MKTTITVSGLLSVLTISGVMALATAAQAQQRMCVVTDSNQVVCGRPTNNNNQQPDRSRENSRDQINDLYRSVLDRNANPNELRIGVRDLERGRSISDIRQDLAQSQEAQRKLNQIYREALGRDADPAGLQGWRNGLMQGRSLQDIRRTIENSQEAQNRRKPSAGGASRPSADGLSKPSAGGTRPSADGTTGQ
jgi:cell division protein YceG involved in septum cleavage